jgi:four helix bundle protein
LAISFWLEPEEDMRNYKDLRVWEETHRLTLDVYKATQSFPKDERFGLTSQMRRASASIPANLAEGCGRRSDGEMARYVQIAMGSGAELSYHLLLARDLGFVRSEDYAELDANLERLMKMLSALSAKVRNSFAAQNAEPKAKSQQPKASSGSPRNLLPA